jgi:TolA-binding protein
MAAPGADSFATPPVGSLSVNCEDDPSQATSDLVTAAAVDSPSVLDEVDTSDTDSSSLSILALQHRVALLKARTLQHQQLIAEMRRREQELEVTILRRQLAQLREQVSDRADQLSQLRHRCRLVSELALSVNRVMETRAALASGNSPDFPPSPPAI